MYCIALPAFQSLGFGNGTVDSFATVLTASSGIGRFHCFRLLECPLVAIL